MSDRLERWRLVLGQAAEPELGRELSGQLLGMDRTLEALYDSDRQGGLGASSPNVARWLGDIREYFPASVVKLMQQDALDRLNLRQMLLEPELLGQVEPDVHLVANLLALRSVIPARTKETARQVVRRVVEELERKLKNPMHQAVRGALQRSQRTARPRPNEIDWHRTIHKNLRHYSAEHGSVVAERVVGFARRRAALRDIVLCVDQSGSMATSVVYSSVFGAVLASLRSVSTRFVLFDTAVADLTDNLRDPVDLLFGAQLGGGTDIQRALTYCQQVTLRPAQTILVLITDLYEGGDSQRLLARAAELKTSGVHLICLLALNDQGAPSYDHENARALAALGIPAFACTPDLFPELMAAAIQRQDVTLWAARHNIVLGS
ncbi:MAG TPA: VWA domain-containing protein [Polyangiaceae bacterium]|nr:VWA domain-containing protein [Polyangiaceae bacterium]